MQVREVLEVYRAHPPLGRFSFRRLVGMYGSGPVPPSRAIRQRIRRLKYLKRIR